MASTRVTRSISKAAATNATTTPSNPNPKPQKTPKPTQPKQKERPSQEKPNLQIIEETGDIFTAAPNTLIIHACNCQGSWGAGIAAAFRSHYPNAYKEYASHCKSHSADELVGTAQLIPPVDGKHFVGCLYTSRHYGKKRDSPERILEMTRPAMRDLLRKVGERSSGVGERERVGEVRMCKINSGMFGVPWEQTREVLEGIEVEKGGPGVVKVVSPA